MKHLKAKRRATYPYICASCRKKRMSLVYDRAVNSICSKCRRDGPAPNQPTLFDQVIPSDTPPEKA